MSIDEDSKLEQNKREKKNSNVSLDDWRLSEIKNDGEWWDYVICFSTKYVSHMCAAVVHVKLTIVRARTSIVATTIVMIAIYPGSGGTGCGSGLFLVKSLAVGLW